MAKKKKQRLLELTWSHADVSYIKKDLDTAGVHASVLLLESPDIKKLFCAVEEERSEEERSH